MGITYLQVVSKAIKNLANLWMLSTKEHTPQPGLLNTLADQ